MSDFQAIADRVEIEALRGEFTDAAMMCDYDRVASLFTPDGALRMPDVPVELVGRDQIRAWRERREAMVEYFVQTAHPGTIQLDGDTASGRAYLHELIGLRDGGSHQNFAIYHDRYQRTGDGWKFTERVYEVRYLDTTPLSGTAPQAGGQPAGRRPVATLRRDDLRRRRSRLEQELPLDSPAGQADVRVGRAVQGEALGDARAESSGRELADDDADGLGPLMLAGQVVTSGHPAQAQGACAAARAGETRQPAGVERGDRAAGLTVEHERAPGGEHVQAHLEGIPATGVIDEVSAAPVGDGQHGRHRVGHLLQRKAMAGSQGDRPLGLAGRGGNRDHLGSGRRR